MKILIKKEIAGYKPNTIVDVNELNYTDMIYWYRRLADSAIDESCELIKSEINPEEKNEKTENVVQSGKNRQKKYSLK